jgi:hypothetical protein
MASATCLIVSEPHLAPGPPAQRRAKPDLDRRYRPVPRAGSYHDASVAARVCAGSAQVATDRDDTYWDAQRSLEEAGYTGLQFHDRSTFMSQRLDDMALRVARRYLRTWPGTSQPDGQADLRLFQIGGAMNRPREATALVHRNSKWLAIIVVVGLNLGETDSPQQIEEMSRGRTPAPSRCCRSAPVVPTRISSIPRSTTEQTPITVRY